MSPDRDALITGIGLISCLGQGEDAHMAALDAFAPVVDSAKFAPYAVHPMTALTLAAQIPKRGDQRQMEPWQQIGVYAAGLALDEAKAKGDTALLERMDMIVAAGGGERDYAADSAILAALPTAEDPERYLNEHLLTDIRPTLFLAQLSNLLAGNISIVHGVIGSSRTFMGEEAAGADALRIACARIQAGQSDICLVGGSYNAQREDSLLHLAMGHMMRRGEYAPVWARQADGGGAIAGSVGCFMVVESRAHAAKRGVAAKAKISGVLTDRCGRGPGQSAAIAAAQFAALGGKADAAISAASGATGPTADEKQFLDGLGLPVRAVASAIGHSLEPSFPAAVALAAMSIGRGKLFPPLDPAEQAFAGAPSRLLVTSWGMWRGEASALVQAA